MPYSMLRLASFCSGGEIIYLDHFYRGCFKLSLKAVHQRGAEDF